MTAAPWGERPHPALPAPAPFRFGRDVPYRLDRLRRLWLAAMAPPVLALLALHGLGPWPALQVAATLVWGLAAAALLTAFPARSHFEMLGGAVATAVCLLVAGFGREVSGGAYLYLAMLWVIVAAAVGVALEWAEPRSPRIRARAGAFRRLKLPPEVASDALATRPGRSWPGSETGAADGDGWFEPKTARRVFDFETRGVRQVIFRSQVRIVAQDDLGQVVEVRPEDAAPGRLTLAAVPDRGGCTVRLLWQFEALPVLTVVLHALGDRRGDALQADADVLEGLPPKAIWWQPEVSPVARLAALLPPAPDGPQL